MRVIDADKILEDLAILQICIGENGFTEDELNLIKWFEKKIIDEPTCFDFEVFKKYLKDDCKSSEADVEKAWEKWGVTGIHAILYETLAERLYQVFEKFNLCCEHRYQERDTGYSAFLKKSIEASEKTEKNKTVKGG
jgi:hypothetical protein